MLSQLVSDVILDFGGALDYTGGIQIRLNRMLQRAGVARVGRPAANSGTCRLAFTGAMGCCKNKKFYISCGSDRFPMAAFPHAPPIARKISASAPNPAA